MLNNEKDFVTLYENLKSRMKQDGKLIILIMDGAQIHHHFLSNDGKLTVKNNDKIVFELEAKYDYKNIKSFFGQKINVYLSGTYGLNEKIEENIVFPSLIKKFYTKYGFKLESEMNFLDVYPNESAKLESYEKKVIGLYNAYVFVKE